MGNAGVSVKSRAIQQSEDCTRIRCSKITRTRKEQRNECRKLFANRMGEAGPYNTKS